MKDGFLNISVVGVDLGGTNIRAGKVSNSEIQESSQSLVPATNNPQEVIDLIIKTIGEVFSDDIEGIGIGIPSLINREQGIVYDVQNIPSWDEVHLKEILEMRFNVPVFLDNDANCFALGERFYGHGQNTDDFVGITLGTGLGSGIIKNGKLLQDANCGSGEFGSIPYMDSIYEDYCSGKFFLNNYNTKGEILYKKALQGDVAAGNAFKVFGEHIGNAIKTIMFAVDPAMIIIGGSIASAKMFYEESMLACINTFPYSKSTGNLKIEFSDQVHPAILGASALVLNGFGEKIQNLTTQKVQV